MSRLCKGRLHKPVGAFTYITRPVESLPPAFRGSLPGPRELAAELAEETAAED